MTGQPSPEPSRKLLLVAAVSLLALVLAALLVDRRQKPTTYASGTPEAVVQAYVKAIVDDRRVEALALFTPDLRQRCEASFAPDRFFYSVKIASASIVRPRRDTSVNETSLVVQIHEESSGGLFSSGGRAHDELVELDRLSGRWAIRSVAWPMFMCNYAGPRPTVLMPGSNGVPVAPVLPPTTAVRPQ
jgi:hypothetical protein